MLGELFCGPGGLAVGATTADVPGYCIRHKWANDYDSSTCETYRKNICPDDSGSVICEDVRKLDLSKLPPIDALAFGFPCNDFSVVGEQKGFGGTYGPLYSYGVSVLRSHRPKWFLAENVGGLKSANEGKAFGKILVDLQESVLSLSAFVMICLMSIEFQVPLFMQTVIIHANLLWKIRRYRQVRLTRNSRDRIRVSLPDCST